MLFFDALFVLTGILGAVGSGSIILVHLCFPGLRSPTRTVLVFLSVADLAQSLFFCLYTPEALRDDTYCAFHTAWGIFAAASSFFWTACAAYVVFRTVAFPDIPIRWSEWLSFHLISWGYPAAVALHCVANRQSYAFEYPFDGGRQGWFLCLGRSYRAEIAEYQAPLIGCWVFTTIMYALARHSLDGMPFFVELQDRGHGGHELHLRTKLILVPLIFVVLRVWSLLDMILLWHRRQSLVLLTLRAVCDPLQGFCNALVFLAMTHRVKQTIQRTLFDASWRDMRLEASDLAGGSAALSYGTRYQYTAVPDLTSSSK
jgi:hypothetical protein